MSRAGSAARPPPRPSRGGRAPPSHDALRGVPGCFDRTLEAAGTALAQGLPFQVNTLVSKQTLANLPAIDEVVRGLGAARWSLFFLISVGRGMVLEPISPRECEDLFAWLAERPAGAGAIVTTTEAPHFRRVLLQKRHGSPAGRHAAGIRDGNGIMFISHTGEINPSGFFPIPAGSVRRGDPVTVYRESPVFRALRRVDLFGGRCGRRGGPGGRALSRHRRSAGGGSTLRLRARDGEPGGGNEGGPRGNEVGGDSGRRGREMTSIARSVPVSAVLAGDPLTLGPGGVSAEELLRRCGIESVMPA